MRLLDRAINYISPKRGVKRELARQTLKLVSKDVQASGYSNHGASRVKKNLIGWHSDSKSPDRDIVDNLKILRERSRDLYMGAPLATGGLKTKKTNVVGAGLTLNAQIDAEFLGLSEEEARAKEKHIEREFSIYAESKFADASINLNFYQQQPLVFLSRMVNGDVFGLTRMIKRGKRYDLAIQLIEADMVCNPSPTPPEYATEDIHGGIEIGPFGETKAYWIANKYPEDPTLKIPYQPLKWTRIPKYGQKSGRLNVIHLMNHERIGQRRGVPELAPVIVELKNISRYTEAEITAAVVSAFFTVFIETEDQLNPAEASFDIEDQVDSEDQNTIEMGSGSVIGLAPGEKAKIADPTRPNKNFDSFITPVTRLIGTALEIPFEILIKHFTASYSASRAALLEFWKVVASERILFAQDWCQSIYELWFDEAVAKGYIEAPGYFDNELIKRAYVGNWQQWKGPGRGMINPEVEMKASALKVKAGYSTYAQETAEITGGNHERNATTLVAEEKFMNEVRKLRKEGEYGDY